MIFRARVRGAFVEIRFTELLRENPELERMQAYMREAAGAGKELLADRALAGFMARCLHAYGEGYLKQVSTALENIWNARGRIDTELNKILNGEVPDLDKIDKAYEQIDLNMPNVLDPSKAPVPKVPLATLLGGGTSGMPPLTVAELLGRIKSKLSGTRLNELQAAESVDAGTLGRLLLAENEGTLKPSAGTVIEGRPYEKMVASLREAGWDKPRIDALMENIEALNKDYRESPTFTPAGSQAHTDAAIAALADPALALPNPKWLQWFVRRNPTLQGLLRSNPEQLMELWRNYRSKTRGYGFGLYTWFNMHSVRGHLGEFSAAFQLGEAGLIFWKAPTEFDVNTPGTDLVCYDPASGQLFVIDNKSYKANMLYEVSSLMRNFPKNLADDVAEFRAKLGTNAEPGMEAALRRAEAASKRISDMCNAITSDKAVLKQMLNDNQVVKLPDGRTMPIQEAITGILQESRISRVITNAGGKLEQISKALKDAGIEIANLNESLTEPTP